MHIIMSTIYGTNGYAARGDGTTIGALRANAIRRLADSLDFLATWQERAAGRYRLANLDDRMLRDVGLDRADISREIDKPFWRS